MSSWHSNQMTLASPGIYTLVEHWRRCVEHGGTTLKINVILLYFAMNHFI
jgi:hypothetical protein